MRLYRGLALLVFSAFALLLPSIWTAAAFVAAAVVWLWIRPFPSPSWFPASGLLIAAAVLASQVAVLDRAGSDRGVESFAQAYQEFLSEFDDRVGDVASVLGEGVIAASQAEQFGALQAHASAIGDPGLAFLLIDPDGQVVAWAGESLLHNLEDASLPQEGVDFVASYRAISVFSVRALGGGPRPWRWIVGRSFARDRLPFAPGPGLDGGGFRWSLAYDSTLTPIETAGTVLGSSFGISLLVDRDPSSPPTLREALGWPWHSALLGLVLLGVFVRGFREWAAQGTKSDHLKIFLVVSAFLGAVCVLSAFGLGRRGIGTLALAALFVLAAAKARSMQQTRLRLLLRYVFGVSLLFLSGWLYQRYFGSVDLSAQLSGSAEVLALRISLIAVSVSVFYVAHARSSGGRVWAFGSFAFLLAAAAFHDRELLGLTLLVGAAATAAQWIPGWRTEPGHRLSFTLVVFSILSAATAWELSYRLAIKDELEGELHTRAILPGRDVLEEWKTEIETFFASDVAQELVHRRVDRSEMKDLAVALWRESPLARRNALSALIVDTGEAEPARFSYGLPLRGYALDDEAVWDVLPAGERQELLWLEGGSLLELDGLAWGEALFWLVPLRPLEPGSTFVQDLEIDLLRAGPLTAGRQFSGGASVSVYALDGSVIRSPWPTERPLSGSFAERSQGRVSTPAGEAWYWSTRDGVAMVRMHLPVLSLVQGLERVGTHSLSVLMGAGICALALLFFGFSRAEFRRLTEDWGRSYSKRMIAVFTLLLLLPLLLLNLVLFRTMGDRLEDEHRGAATVGLQLAQRLLSEYLVALEPGFQLRTAIDGEVLDWLSGVVQREVNIYWNSRYFLSSRPELFSAGVLPERIPGDIYSSLVLQAAPLASHTSRVDDVSYLELYAPLVVAGNHSTTAPLFYLSTPLVAQEEALTAQLNQLARQAFLVTAALFLLLLAAGASLARSFTRPLMEIIEGTHRIAAGATSLGLSPREPELLSLVTAIDAMAGRIADGRRELVREKKLVEEVVEHITAGVLSIGADNQILMRNHVAGELLGLETGDTLHSLRDREDLAPVAEFLDNVGSVAAQTTVRLRTTNNAELEWSLVWVPVAGPGEPSALFVVEDATEVLRGQRLNAWAEMARMIAHEVKNPLTPIRLSTEHLKQVYAEDPEHLDQIFERCTDNILRQVDELREISMEFSAYSHIPDIDLQKGDLCALAASIAEAYASAAVSGVEVTLNRPETAVETRFDSRLLGRAIRNLVENAVRASGPSGTVELRVAQENGAARLWVSDRGPGVPDELIPRIFEPYFSTQDSGTGLGLPIAKRIVEEHSGNLSARNRRGGGLEVRMTLPGAGS